MATYSEPHFKKKTFPSDVFVLQSSASDIVDKTASFVARNGPEFESRIRQNELNNPKFNFLNSTDPYHNYYKHKVKEFVEGRGLYIHFSIIIL